MWTAEFKNLHGEIQTKEFHSRAELDFFVRGLAVCGHKAKVAFQN